MQKVQCYKLLGDVPIKNREGTRNIGCGLRLADDFNLTIAGHAVIDESLKLSGIARAKNVIFRGLAMTGIRGISLGRTLKNAASGKVGLISAL